MLQIYINSLFLPLSLAVTLLLFTRTNYHSKFIRISLSLIPVIIMFFFGANYILFYFVGAGGLSEVVMYHIAVGFGGIDSWWEFIELFEFMGIIVLVMLLLFGITYRYILPFKYKKLPPYMFVFALFGIFLHPLLFNVPSLIKYYNMEPSDDDRVLFNQLNSDNKYKLSNITIENNKNIIFLMVESLDQDFYRNDKLFPNLMPHLETIANNHIAFTNIQQLEVIWSTIAGTTGAIQCGIPLVVRNSKEIDSFAFLPNAYCLGDYLKQNGYTIQFITADNPKFTLTENFYLQHGFTQNDIYGKKDIEKLSSAPIQLGSWGEGVYDKDLLAFVKSRYQYLSRKPAPFSLFVSTLDTHGKHGYLHPDCKNYQRENEIEMLASIRCTDTVINDFYNFLKEQDNVNDTILVIVSDHVLPSNEDLFVDIPMKERRNTFILVDFENMNSQEIDSAGSTLDVGITVLDYLNASTTTLNFGRSLLDDKTRTETLVELFGITNIDNFFRRSRSLFSEFWVKNNLD